MDSDHLLNAGAAVNAEDPALPTLGARIVCAACAAMSYPCCEAVREDFTLRRYDDHGRPSESPEKGLWYCERHRPPLLAPQSHSARVAPVAALVDLELLIANGVACIEEAAAADPDDLPDVVETFRAEVARGLTSLRKAIAT